MLLGFMASPFVAQAASTVDTDEIEGLVTTVAAVGAAVLGVYVAIMCYRVVRRAL
jgi:hypothetical protein